MSLTVVKLGGSAITDKRTPFSIKTMELERVAEAISRAVRRGRRVVVVHGGGSFGHPLAKKYNLARGLSESSVIGLSETIDAMRELSLRVTRALRRAGVSVIPLQPSSCVHATAGTPDLTPIVEQVRRSLRLNLTPVLWGDVILDDVKGCTILSGDDIVLALAESLRPSNVVFVTEAGGVYVRRGSERELISELSPTQLRALMSSIDAPEYDDVTGGMRRKLEVILRLAELGIPVCVIGPEDPDNVVRAIELQKFTGTLVRPA